MVLLVTFKNLYENNFVLFVLKLKTNTMFVLDFETG